MKKIYMIAALLISSSAVLAQAQYEISQDLPDHPKVKILRGIVNKYLIQNDSSFTWYKANQAGYTPDASILTAFENAKEKVQFVVFGGTWCEDTQFILPKFYRIQELSGVSDSRITFFGVNRQKQSLESIAAAFAVTNVPTIIVLKDGKELGRVVEYGKTGKWDKELADILKGI